MRLATLAVCFAMCLGVAAGEGLSLPPYHKRPGWLPKVWWAIGECETGLDTHHSTTDYVGAFGFARGTWAQYRRHQGRRDPDWHLYPEDATRASLWQQWHVALREYRDSGFSGWGCYTHGGYLVWMGRA